MTKFHHRFLPGERVEIYRVQKRAVEIENGCFRQFAVLHVHHDQAMRTNPLERVLRYAPVEHARPRHRHYADPPATIAGLIEGSEFHNDPGSTRLGPGIQ
ncbi:hypothetical protein BDS110ZK12_66040 [Bradyrhizobium diazoefficiens]|uniref:Uncharacterized protein n=1 Tax=Bradyrhizobium diazoefficiens TaxID=1355477 RepID=A0A809XFB8_9BRAD|nr:hypothetical protein H12S4_84330 [Bradyrhizobium diazoefficiens]BCA24882.1 hypothetical protein BDHH15_80970 [Bradyrhizobium diazoefficiens]BCE25620.1 hypothetical protein XF1B_83010 [Bradyrhizobium diazoefficiens]BCE51878.1 hypothetical protein XF4B_82270 [Bradyrhizobium diazoefficiens]BCE69296.1 hypothetical protein XF6B_80950 [Bradyrhizobium diazoefficiens]